MVGAFINVFILALFMPLSTQDVTAVCTFPPLLSSDAARHTEACVVSIQDMGGGH